MQWTGRLTCTPSGTLWQKSGSSGTIHTDRQTDRQKPYRGFGSFWSYKANSHMISGHAIGDIGTSITFVVAYLSLDWRLGVLFADFYGYFLRRFLLIGWQYVLLSCVCYLTPSNYSIFFPFRSIVESLISDFFLALHIWHDSYFSNF